MFKTLLFLLFACPALAAPEVLRIRVLSWDIGYRPEMLSEWTAKLDSEVDAALKSGADVVLFPELLAWGISPYRGEGEDSARFVTRTMNDEVLPALERRLGGSNALVVLGSYPHKDEGATHAFNRAVIWHAGRWHFQDKIRPTQAEQEKERHPIAPGNVVQLFDFRGGKAAVLVCYSVEMPEIAAALKREGVQLVLVPSATSDLQGLGRVRRSASARAVELGAVVAVASLTGTRGNWTNVGAPAVYLPSQWVFPTAELEGEARDEGFFHEDYPVPWRELLNLHRDNPRLENRPFLTPAGPFTTQPATTK